MCLRTEQRTIETGKMKKTENSQKPAHMYPVTFARSIAHFFARLISTESTKPNASAHRLFTLSSILALFVFSNATFATPAQPTGLTGTVSGSTVSLTWDRDPSGQTNGYNIYANNNYIDTILADQGPNTYNGTIEAGRLTSFTVVAFSSAPVEFSPASDSVELPESLIPNDLTIPPSTPTNLTGEIQETTVSLSWTASTDDEAVQGYNLYQNESYLTTVFDTTYEGQVTAGESYSWYVVAFDIRNNFSSRSERLRLPDTGPVDTTIPPSVPGGLSGNTSAAGNNNLSATLSWTASTDDQQVAGYNVYTDGAYTTTVFDTSYATDIAADSFTTFNIVAFDFDDNFSAQSQSITLPNITDPAALEEPPTQPQQLAGSINGTTLSLSWSASSDNIGVGGYNVYQNNDYLTTVFDTNYTGSVTSDTLYTYYVVAFDRNGNFSTQSEQIVLPEGSELVQPQAPLAPATLTGSLTALNTNGEHAVELSWSAAQSSVAISGYNVYQNNQYLTTVFDTSYSGEVPDDGPYSYYVVAFDGFGSFSPASQTLSLPDNANQPPHFDGFVDQTTDAGQLWELIVRPLDNDGGAPGLFGGVLPTGMRSTDNFDGTRTLSWRPLQPEVGDHRITFTAFDAQDPSISVTETITLSVVLPEDLSTIPNPGPTIDAIGSFRVRTGDTVVMRVKAVDANGTIARLEILNPPEGSTFDVFPDDPQVRVLRWTTTPGDLGTVRFDFLATDADDPALTFSSSVELEIVDPSEYIREGERLRNLADARNFQFGYAHLLEWYAQTDGDLYASVAAEEFNLLSTENSMKMGYMWPEPGRFRFEGADREVEFARANNMDVHGHPLLWYTILPPWIINSPVEQRESIMNTFIDTVVPRYREDVTIWDVVNEALEADGTMRNSVWFEAMGEEYIDMAFRRTRALDPDATLLYNEFDVSFNGPKSDGMYALMQRLLADGVPIDGVGFQMHFTTSFDRFDEVASNLQRFADLGLDVYITELDVAMEPGATTEQQAAVFADAVSICLAQPRCKAAQIWGFTDRYSWLGDREALVLDRDYQAKPAYRALQNVLSQ